jgi:hypothetical protein
MRAGQRADFFISRRGSVAAIAREVEQVLAERGYKVIVQDYDIPLTANFVEAMHEAIKNSRDLIVLFTSDYEASPYTRKEFTSFEADRAQSAEERRIVVLRCEEVPLRGLLAPNVYQDLVDVSDPEERRRRIISAAEGQSQAVRPPPRPFVGVPPRIDNFVGRGAELDRLDAILLGGQSPAAVTPATVGRAALRGMGGTGKTSLAVEYAHRYRDLYAGVWWCPAENRDTLLAALVHLGVELGVTASDDQNREPAAKEALRRLAQQRATWLMIYDNVSGPDEITDLIPMSGARLLITSRFSDWRGWAEEVTVDVLPLADAIEYLQNRSGHRDEEGANVLAEAVGRLPLALDHAAAYCRRTQLRFLDYADKVARLIATLPRGVAYPRSVMTTFNLAIEEAAKQCADAAILIAYLAHCPRYRIEMSLVRGAVADETLLMEAVMALVEVSLVKHNPMPDGTPALTVHPLVWTVAQLRAEADGTGPIAWDRLLGHLAVLFPELFRLPQLQTPGLIRE